MSLNTTLKSGPLQTERNPDGTRTLLRDLIVEVNSDKILVPAGTRTDYSTVPWFLRWFVLWSKIDIAGVVHDHLYAKGIFSRKKSDEIWRLIAFSGEHNANSIQSWLGWLALRIFGGVVWGNYRSKDKGNQEK